MSDPCDVLPEVHKLETGALRINAENFDQGYSKYVTFIENEHCICTVKYDYRNGIRVRSGDISYFMRAYNELVTSEVLDLLKVYI